MPAARNTFQKDIPAKELTPEQTIAVLIADLKELRQLHELTKAERDKAIAASETEKKFSASTERSYAAAESQIATLNRALAHQDKAIALQEKTIALVEKQRDDAKREAKRSRKLALLFGAVAAAKILLF